MRKLFYSRLALSNIRRNRKFYFPYILTCICTVAMFYIICALNAGNALNGMLGEMILRSYMAMGAVVIAIFAIIFLFYTNSFLTRRRRREFGLYNILGMEKRHIARVMLIETLLIALLSLTLGVAAGAGLAKLVTLATMKMIHAKANAGFEFVWPAARLSLQVFAGIFAFSYLVELIRVRKLSAIALMRSAEQGEREPKTKWLMTILGLICLGGGYYIAVATEDPVKATFMFFLAVILVILGTYMLFTAGSIAFLKMLRSRKNYYYKPNHFISVSGMIYRMKQNAAGLASICILSTMVLVMVSATASLAIGTEDSIRSRYPRELEFDSHRAEETDAQGREIIENALAPYGVSPENYMSYRFLTFTAERKGDSFGLQPYDGYAQLGMLTCMLYDDYLNGHPDLELPRPESGEVLLGVKGGEWTSETMQVGEITYSIAGRLDQVDVGSAYYSVWPEYYLLFGDMETLQTIDREQCEAYGSDRSILRRRFAFDIPLEGEALEDAAQAVMSAMSDHYSQAAQGGGFTVTGPRYEGRANQYAMNGGLMFMGVFLGILFLMATVLLMYYKQISEGYDDRARFQIMRKVGLDDSEIRRSIRSQVVTVFFLPLITACIHTGVAFFIVRKVLLIFGLTNVGLFIACTGGVMAVFAVFYIVTYLVTANVYYRIVARDAA